MRQQRVHVGKPGIVGRGGDVDENTPSILGDPRAKPGIRLKRVKEEVELGDGIEADVEQEIRRSEVLGGRP
jgi:hypothetical protein